LLGLHQGTNVYLSNMKWHHPMVTDVARWLKSLILNRIYNIIAKIIHFQIIIKFAMFLIYIWRNLLILYFYNITLFNFLLIDYFFLYILDFLFSILNFCCVYLAFYVKLLALTCIHFHIFLLRICTQSKNSSGFFSREYIERCL